MSTGENQPASAPNRHFLSTAWSTAMLPAESTLWVRRNREWQEIPVASCTSIVQTEPKARLLTLLLGQRVTMSRVPIQLQRRDILWVVQVVSASGRVFKPESTAEVGQTDLKALRLLVTSVEVL